MHGNVFMYSIIIISVKEERDRIEVHLTKITA